MNNLPPCGCKTECFHILNPGLPIQRECKYNKKLEHDAELKTDMKMTDSRPLGGDPTKRYIQNLIFVNPTELPESASEEIPEPRMSFVKNNDETGVELLMMLFPEDWVCLTVVSGPPDTPEFAGTFIRLSELSMIVNEMENLDDGP